MNLTVEDTRSSEAANTLAAFTGVSYGEADEGIRLATERDASNRRLLFVDHPAYPTALKEHVGSVPIEVAGTPRPMKNHLVSIVSGSHDVGHQILSYRISREVVSQGFPVIAVLDNGAGSSAVEASVVAYGRTIAVCPHGIDHALETDKVAEAVVDTGGMLVALPVTDEESTLKLATAFAAEIVTISGFFERPDAASLTAEFLRRSQRAHVSKEDMGKHAWVNRILAESSLVNLYSDPDGIIIGGMSDEEQSQPGPTAIS